MRLFVGVDLPEEVRGRLGEAIAGLRGEVPGVRWIRPENLHITTRFLGETAESQLAELRASLEAAAAAVPCGDRVLVVGLSAIGERRRPRMVWAGVRDEKRVLAGLHDRVERALSSLGYPGEGRDYHAHLTLARLKKRAPGLVEALEGRATLEMGEFPVQELTLFSSRLHPDGARYERLAAFPLGGGEER